MGRGCHRRVLRRAGRCRGQPVDIGLVAARDRVHRVEHRDLHHGHVGCGKRRWLPGARSRCGGRIAQRGQGVPVPVPERGACIGNGRSLCTRQRQRHDENEKREDNCRSAPHTELVSLVHECTLLSKRIIFGRTTLMGVASPQAARRTLCAVSTSSSPLSCWASTCCALRRFASVPASRATCHCLVQPKKYIPPLVNQLRSACRKLGTAPLGHDGRDRAYQVTSAQPRWVSGSTWSVACATPYRSESRLRA